ncbi:MAG: ribosome maturation factor RimM [Filifactoraceae bacterium]
MREYRIGKIVNTHGLKGEVKIYPYTDYPERFDELEYFFLGEKDEKKWELEKVRYQGKMVIGKIKDVNTIEEAESLKDTLIYIDKKNLRELDEDEYMIKDLIGLKVYTEEEQYIGEVRDVLQYSANDVYVVKNEEKEYLIPAINEFVPIIDIESKKIVIKPIKGMID